MYASSLEQKVFPNNRTKMPNASDCNNHLFIVRPTQSLLSCQVEDGPLTGIEVEYISREVESGLMDLVLEMEMEYCLDEELTSHNPSDYLAYALLSGFERGTCSKLAKYLYSAGFFTTSRRFILFVY